MQFQLKELQRQSYPEKTASEHSIIYYYSKFKLLEENILQNLLFCKKFRANIAQLLDSYWQEQAVQTVFIDDQSGRRFLSYAFMVDTFVYSWIQLLNNTGISELNDQHVQIFLSIVKGRVSQFLFIEEKLNVLSQNFYNIANQLSIDTFGLLDRVEQMPSLALNQIEALIVLREKTKSPQREERLSRKRIQKGKSFCTDEENVSNTLAEMVENLTLNDICELPEARRRGVTASERTHSDLKEFEQFSENLKAKKFTKQQEKLQSQYIISNLQEPDEIIKVQWQVAKQHVVIIWEVPLENNNAMMKERIRFIQPSDTFYKQVLQLWMMEMCSSQRKIGFNSFVFKAKHFFSTQWNERYLIPLFAVFQALEKSYKSVTQQLSLNDSQNQNEILKLIICKLNDTMRELWTQNIIQNAQKLQSK